jgi:hypothetical protein
VGTVPLNPFTSRSNELSVFKSPSSLGIISVKLLFERSRRPAQPGAYNN